MKTLDFEELLTKVPDLKEKIGENGFNDVKNSQPHYKCLGKCEREFISETKEETNIMFCFSCQRIMEV